MHFTGRLRSSGNGHDNPTSSARLTYLATVLRASEQLVATVLSLKPHSHR
jgi:hypothetical protein